MILECGCPEHYPDWHNQDIDLGGQCAHILPIPMLAHMPMSYDSYLHKQREEVGLLELKEQWPGMALMATGAFRGKLIRLIENTTSPSRRIEYLPRPFQLHARLHPGDIGSIRTPVHEMQLDLLDRGRAPQELYLGYITCTRCYEQRGGHKTLLLRRWVDSPTLKKRVKPIA